MTDLARHCYSTSQGKQAILDVSVVPLHGAGNPQNLWACRARYMQVAIWLHEMKSRDARQETVFDYFDQMAYAVK